MKVRKEIEVGLLTPPYQAGAAPEVFPTLSDEGWEFCVDPREVPVVITGDGRSFVGTADEDGILWCAGTAIVLEGGDWRQAQEQSLSWSGGCRQSTVIAGKFRVIRGFGQTPVLAIA
jgi:hypothetical protein